MQRPQCSRRGRSIQTRESGGFVDDQQGRCKPNVGAGLLANALCQLTEMLSDTAHSRASPLPQGFALLQISDRQFSRTAG
ncbi:hypothetical protein C3E98_001085 [Pseudomonas sp. MWU13-2625]|nr:hypothetical protein C3E98_001085 [Pseudomonas sp. MWU13-2625]